MTGAASGIGHALASGFLTDGALVVAVDVQRDGLRALEDRGALALAVDVSDPQAVEALVAQAVEHTSRLDVLVNNAGLGFSAPVSEHAPDQFERLLRVNLFGPFYGMKFALPVMQRQGYGRIINLLSRHAEAGAAGFSAYGSSKAALWAVTRSAARETRDENIRVNGLIPGPTQTGMNPRGQDPERVYPTARMLATLPADGPTGRAFWDLKEYPLFDPSNRAVAERP